MPSINVLFGTENKGLEELGKMDYLSEKFSWFEVGRAHLLVFVHRLF